MKQGFMVLIGEEGVHEIEDYEDECVEQATVVDDGKSVISKDQAANKFNAIAKMITDEAKSDISKSKTLEEMIAIANKATSGTKKDSSDEDDNSEENEDSDSSGMDSGDARESLFLGRRKGKTGVGNPKAKAKVSAGGGRASSSASTNPKPSATSPAKPKRWSAATLAPSPPTSKAVAQDRLGGGAANESVHITDGRCVKLKKNVEEDIAKMANDIKNGKDLSIDDDINFLGNSKAFTDAIKTKVKVCNNAKAKIKGTLYKIERSLNRAAMKDEEDKLTKDCDDISLAMTVLQCVQGGRSSLTLMHHNAIFV